MNLKRLPYWETRLLPEFIRARALRPFAWGQNDCSLFVADAVLAVTGVDPAPEVRGRYRSANGALRVLRLVAGVKDFADGLAWFANRAGMRPVDNPHHAGRGDVVLVINAGREVSGIVSLDGRWVLSPGEEGLDRVCRMQIARAWTY